MNQGTWELDIASTGIYLSYQGWYLLTHESAWMKQHEIYTLLVRVSISPTKDSIFLTPRMIPSLLPAGFLLPPAEISLIFRRRFVSIVQKQKPWSSQPSLSFSWPQSQRQARLKTFKTATMSNHERKPSPRRTASMLMQRREHGARQQLLIRVGDPFKALSALRSIWMPTPWLKE